MATHDYFFGFGRVSTTVVEGRRIASLTGMYRPVLASRPILLGGVFCAMVGYLSIGFSCPLGRILPDVPLG